MDHQTAPPDPSALRAPEAAELPSALVVLMDEVREELGFVPNFLKGHLPVRDREHRDYGVASLTPSAKETR
jgi:hypothetical protein